MGLFLSITSSLFFGGTVPTNNLLTFFGGTVPTNHLFTFFCGTVPTNNLFTELTMFLGKASKNKHNKLGFFDEIRWGRGRGVQGAQPVNGHYLNVAPSSERGGGVRGQVCHVFVLR